MRSFRVVPVKRNTPRTVRSTRRASGGKRRCRPWHQVSGHAALGGTCRVASSERRARRGHGILTDSPVQGVERVTSLNISTTGRGAGLLVTRSPAPPRSLETHMATDLPWFPMYPADFLVSTATMTPTQGWVYTQLLMYAWTNGAVPDDRAACAAMTRSKLTETDWSVVRGRFRKTPAGLVNPRMEQERHAASKRHDLAVKAGRKGASARWSVPDTDRVAIATPSPQNGNPNSSPAMATPMAITITTTTTPTTTPSQPVTVRPTRRGTVSSDVDNRAALRALIAKEQEGRCEDE